MLEPEGVKAPFDRILFTPSTNDVSLLLPERKSPRIVLREFCLVKYPVGDLTEPFTLPSLTGILLIASY